MEAVEIVKTVEKAYELSMKKDTRAFKLIGDLRGVLPFPLFRCVADCIAFNIWGQDYAQKREAFKTELDKLMEECE